MAHPIVWQTQKSIGQTSTPPEMRFVVRATTEPDVPKCRSASVVAMPAQNGGRLTRSVLYSLLMGSSVDTSFLDSDLAPLASVTGVAFMADRMAWKRFCELSTRMM